MLRFLAATALLALASQPRPAQAQLVTAAWAAAITYCQAAQAGLSMDDSVRIALRDNWTLWSREIADPNFARLMVNQAVRSCPEQFR
jgi:hypothetical protein